ncbi:hypothetical protein QTP88_002362 [Uroleucon formosanum]
MKYKECNFKTQNSNLSNFYTNTKIKIVNEIEDFVMKNSQWRLHQILSLGVNINKYVPFKGSSYIPLPEHIQNKYAILNVKNKDDKCFLWAILSALHHVEKDGQRVTKYIPFENEFDNELKEVDLSYPKELHDLHSDFSLAPEKHFDNKQFPKLLTTLYDKKRNIIHYETLKLYIKLCLKLEKIHKVLEFNQSSWLKVYIDFNTNLRSEAKNEFQINEQQCLWTYHDECSKSC